MTKKKYFNPKKDKTIHSLIECINVYNIEIRFEKGNFKSSDCLVEGEKVLILNRNLKLDQIINYLRDYLKEIKNA